MSDRNNYYRQKTRTDSWLGEKLFKKNNQRLNILKRISIRYSEVSDSFQCGVQLLIWGEKWSNNKRFLGGYFRHAAPCQWGRVAVVVWAGDCCNLSGWRGLML